MKYTVISTIQSKDRSNPPVEVKWYTGGSLAVAVAAMAQAATTNTETNPFGTITLSVRLDITEED